MTPSQIALIILNVTSIATFIGIFFFTYGKTVEEHVVKSQSEFIAENISNDLSVFLTKDIAQNIIKNLDVPDMSREDAHVQEQNQLLQNNAFKILSILFISGIVISFLICKYYNINFFKLIKTNLIIIFFVGLTEYIFLTYIGQKFISADPNFVRYKILKIMKEKIPPKNINMASILTQAENYLQPQDKKLVQNYLQKNNITLSGDNIPIVQPIQLT